MPFSFRNIDSEPSQPEGEYQWIFRYAGYEKTFTVPGNGPNDAWEGIRFHMGDQWENWILLGREDLVADEVYDREVFIDFEQRYPETVKRWRENDAD